MLKLGVVSRRQLPSAHTPRGRRRHVSLLLLQELARDPHVAAEEYDALVGNARMPNGVWKLTRCGRFAAIDAAVVALLRQRYAPASRVAVWDLAASTGVTSLELYRALRDVFALDFVASDLYRDVVAVRRPGSGAAVVFDTQGHEVQYVAGPFVLPAGLAESAAYPVNRALRSWLRARLVPAARATLGRVDVEALRPFEAVAVGAHEVVRMPIMTREALETIAARDDFRFVAHDITQPLPARAHVVRAMNILAHVHLTDEQRRRALRNCVEAVEPGGLLVVGWSPTVEARTVEATIYSVRDGVLTRLQTFDGGSEIDALAASMFPVQDVAGDRAAG